MLLPMQCMIDERHGQFFFTYLSLTNVHAICTNFSILDFSPENSYEQQMDHQIDLHVLTYMSYYIHLLAP